MKKNNPNICIINPELWDKFVARPQQIKMKLNVPKIGKTVTKKGKG